MPLTKDEVLGLVALAGGVANVLNARHALVKEKGWKEKPPSAEVFAAAVAKEPNLLRRPILVVDNKLIVGLDKAAYSAL